MIRAEALEKRYQDRILFQDATFRIAPPERLGVVGANGAGKTTLLRLLMGLEEPTAGQVYRERRATFGYLPQEIPAAGSQTILGQVLAAFPRLAELEEQIAALARSKEVAAGHAAALKRLGSLQHEYEALGGWTKEGEAKMILFGLGFQKGQFHAPFSSLSGGWRMRVILAGLLLAQPRFLFLDEPTNHLDLEAALWLETFLLRWTGGLVLISHDRVFLDKLATSIMEIEGGKIRIYTGNYSAYVRAREVQAEHHRAAYVNQQKKIQATERFIERFRYKNTKASQVQSRIKQLNKLRRIEAPPATPDAFHLRLPEPERGPRKLVTLQGVKKSFGDLAVYSDLNLTIERGWKLGLVGPNGAGKSTLLKLLAGVETPTAGRLIRAPEIRISYYAQHQLEVLHPENTVLETIQQEAPHWSRTEVRSYLGGFYFSGDTVEKKVLVLSGGEKARLALARMLCTPAHLLLLDEPTNHLDLPSRDGVERALARFEGAIVCISHDRHFLNTVTQFTGEVGGGTLKLYSGNYDYYRWKKEHTAAPEKTVETQPPAASPPPGLSYAERKRKRNRLEKLKRMVREAEEEWERINTQFQRPEVASDYERLEKLQRRQSACEERLFAALEEEEALERELESRA